MAPHSVEAEEATVGSLLVNPDGYYEVADFLKPEDFFIVRNGWVYEAIMRLMQRRDPVDYVTVLQELRNQQRIDEIGGAAYLTYLINHTPPGIYTEAYGRLVERAATRRRMLAAASEIAQVAHDEDIDTPTAVERGESAWLKVVDSSTPDEALPISVLAADDLDRVEFAMQNPGSVQGIDTGFYELDALTGGMQLGDVTILAGRPGSGKTSLAMSIALHTSKHHPTAFFSLEMSRAQITQRLKSSLSGVSTHKIRTGRLDTDTEWPAYVRATKELQDRHLFIDDKAGITPLQLLTKSRRLVHRYGVELLIIDYVQLMKPGVHREKRELEVAYVSQAVKQIAKDLGVPILLLAQLNREVEGRQDKRPQVSDLRESGSLENDADVVLLIYRDEMYNENTDRPNQADIIIGKHRNGPTGVISLYFRKELTLFSNLQRANLDLRGL